ncbi:MAG: M28 family peptidase [Bacteroidetes bacterium]|nr:M28 family peptidase [Bacteroidota bacterium]
MNQLKTIAVFIPVLSQFSCAEIITSDQKYFTDTVRIKEDLRIITKTEKSRNYYNIETLNFVADYIYREFSKNCDTVYYQSYQVNSVEYTNVIGSIGIDKSERIIVGAHYDVAGDQEGADDNASGVVGIIELSRHLSEEQLNYRVDLVAYSLEEPPFFRTEHMGSFIHAKSLFDEEVKVKGMICLEMIGYFSDKPKSQSYPVGFLKLFYDTKGDYITVVQKFGNGKFGRQVKRLMKKQGLVKTKSFKGPALLPGVDFSDHLNYWNYGYSAVMITNTAFYRNKNYHKNTDKMETLDIRRMALVIDEVYLTIKQFK